jgi:peptide/nickel transport system substrate-binding protein
MRSFLRRRSLAIGLVFVLALVLGTGMAFAAGKARVLRFTMANTPYLDPAVGSDEASSTALSNIYDSLVFPNDDGTVRGMLATKWSVSPDGKVWEFTLRSGVKFHSGSELTAEDVAYSMQRLIDIGEGFGYLFKGRVVGMEAPNKGMVRFTLAKPFGPFLGSLVRLYIVEKKLVQANAKKDGPYGVNGDYGKDWLLTHDAGCGAYKVNEIKQDQYLLADRFPGYWQGFDANNPDQFKLIGGTESVTVKTMMSRQELEATDQYQPMENYDAMAKEIAGVQLASFSAGFMMSLTLNNQVAPTDDVYFRQAVAYLINYNTLITKVYPGSIAAKSMVPSNVAGFIPVYTFTYDLAKAKAALAKSKYAKSLKDYPFEVDWIAETPDREKLALAIQADAAKIGITVNVVKVPWLSLVEAATKAETTPTAATVMTASQYAEAGAMLESRFRSHPVGSWEQCEWVQNEQIDKMIDDAISTADTPKRLKKYEEIQKKLAEMVPTIPLFEQPSKHAYQASYVKWRSAENAKAGKPVVPTLGYTFYARDFQIFPEKMSK